MQIVEKDILTVSSGIIGHQVNCKGIMAAGLAKSIGDKWPLVRFQYQDLVHSSKVYFIGHSQIVKVDPDLWVANLFGQYTYGKGAVYTDYDMLELALSTLGTQADQLKVPRSLIHLPMGLGCGLAGGDWKIVSKIIERTLPEAVVCVLPKQEKQ